METSFAIYEFVGLILALPLSYFLAFLARKHTNLTYKDELDRLYMFYWNGEEEDQLNAWLKVKMLLSQREANPKKEKYVAKKIQEINKSTILANTHISLDGLSNSKTYNFKSSQEKT